MSHLYKERDIIDVLKAEGPLSGGALANKLGVLYEQRDAVTYLWALCTSSERIHTKRIFERYLRINKRNGELYLSPSIPREFSEFAIVSLSKSEAEEASKKLKAHHEEVSKQKKSIAKTAIGNAVNNLRHFGVEEYSCFLLGGDVAYGMASDAPREASNGELVQGSDIDIIILNSGIESDLIEKLDNAMLLQKIMLLRQPYQQEIDYKIKGFDMVKDQSAMDTPVKAVACKIIAESDFLYGNRKLHDKAMELLEQRGAIEKLNELKDCASVLRQEYEKRLLEQLL